MTEPEPVLETPDLPDNQTSIVADEKKVAPFWIGVIIASMFCAAVWAGGEIAKGEIAQQQLDTITAKGKVVKARMVVPPDVVLAPEMIEEVDAFANRIEPYCINSATSAMGKKTRYGLEPGQVLTIRDLK